MTAQQNPALQHNFTNELARLSRAGFPLLPLGAGVDGKGPLLRSWAGPKMTLSRILAPLYRTGSQAYGVRLDGLAVIDCDADSPELVAAMEARFGPSPVHVKTPRGRHLYYRASGKPPNLRGEGLPVDIKTGARAYVVGPWSHRLDGGLYVPAKGLLGVDALPALRAAPAGPPSALVAPLERVEITHRHPRLVKEAVAMVEFVDSVDDLTANLAAFRDDYCADALSFPDSEVTAIAAWAWECRLKNRIYRGRDSAFSLQRQALDALRGCDNDTDAIALYVMLVDLHGHIPGKRFALDFKAMRASGLTRLSIPRLRAARRNLQTVGLLMQVGKHRAGSVHQTFALGRAHAAGGDADNVAPLPKSRGGAGGRV